MTVVSPRDYLGALDWMHAEHLDPSRSWAGLCQKDVRTSYGIGPLFGTAWLAWNGADPEDRHPGTNPSLAPLGSALYYKGSSAAGHVMLAARPFVTGVAAAWSNDLVTHGLIDKVARTAPTTAWRQRYLGFLTAVNDVNLRLAPPPQDKAYEAIGKAIANIAAALVKAREQGDAADVKTFTAEVARLKALYNHARHY